MKHHHMAIAGVVLVLALAGCGTTPAAAPVTVTQAAPASTVFVSAVTTTSPARATSSSEIATTAPVLSTSSKPTVGVDHTALVSLCTKYCAQFKTQRNKPSCTEDGPDLGCAQRIGDTGRLVINLNLDLPDTKVDMGNHPVLRKRIDDAMAVWESSHYATQCTLGVVGDQVGVCTDLGHEVLAQMDAVGVELQTEAASN